MKRYDGETKVVRGILPVDQSAAANTQGEWVSLSKYDSLMVCYTSDVGTGGQDPSVALRQATSATGTGAKTLAAGQWYAVQDATVGDLDDNFAAAGDGDGAFTDDGETACVARVEITADQLDVDNDFEFVQVRVTRGGNTAGKLVAAVYVLRGARYSAAVPDQPTAVA